MSVEWKLLLLLTKGRVCVQLNLHMKFTVKKKEYYIFKSTLICYYSSTSSSVKQGWWTKNDKGSGFHEL